MYVVILLAAFGAVCQPNANAQSSASKPATAAQAAAALDLSQFELIDPVDSPNSQIIAQQSYRTKGKLTDVAKMLQANFKKAGCKELDGTTITDEYASAVFQKKGFTFSLSLTQGGQPGEALVTITNHGNVDLKTIPVPKGATQLYAFPISIAYTAASSVEETYKACQKLLLANGWERFGDTASSFLVKQNAVVLQVSVNECPRKVIRHPSKSRVSKYPPTCPHHPIMAYCNIRTRRAACSLTATVPRRNW